MFYRFLNRRISDKISEFHPIAVKYLSDDIEDNDDKVIGERLKVVRNHSLLHKHFEADQKHLYMINRNYLKFLKAIIFLYQTSHISVSTGICTAPVEIYDTINEVERSFAEATRSLELTRSN